MRVRDFREGPRLAALAVAQKSTTVPEKSAPPRRRGAQDGRDRGRSVLWPPASLVSSGRAPAVPVPFPRTPASLAQQEAVV